jgi:hypothetical protein
VKEGIVYGLNVLIDTDTLHIVVDFGGRRIRFLRGLLASATLHMDTVQFLIILISHDFGSCDSALQRFGWFLILDSGDGAHEHGLRDGSAEAALRLQVRVRRS